MSEYFDSSQNRIVAGSLAKSSEVNAIRDEVGTGFDKLPASADLKLNKMTYCTDTGVADAYVVAMPSTQSSYTTGMEVIFIPTHDNTGASTINVDSIGAKAIKRADGTDLVADDLKTDKFVYLRYNGTHFLYVAGFTSYYKAALTEGTITTGAAGSSADITLTGDAGSQVLDMTIPQGIKGDQGDDAGYSYSAKSANFSATDGNKYIVTATADITVTLPASPNANDYYGFKCYISSGKKIVFDGNGNDIESKNETMTVQVDYISFTLLYADATRGYILV